MCSMGLSAKKFSSEKYVHSNITGLFVSAVIAVLMISGYVYVSG